MKTAALIATALVLASAPASAASVMTSSAGYTGPTLDIGAIGQPFYLFTAGPVALPGGITYTASDSNAVIGTGGYGLGGNGFSTTAIVGVNSGTSWIELTFDTAVSMFGGGFNYALEGGRRVGNSPNIAAFDEADNLILGVDLLQGAPPIVTPGATDAYVFRGIDGEGQMIKRFRMEGSFIILSATTFGDSGAVPEPATWALMIAGFGLVGFAARRRRIAHAS